MPVKIITNDGNKYKLNWIEEKDEKLVSIKNVKREYFDKSEIFQIVAYDPEPLVIPLDSALKHHGAMQILTRDEQGKYICHEFIKINE